MGYSYVLLSVTTVLLILARFRFKGIYRRQAATLMLAFPLPWIANAAYLAGLAGADKGYDFTPVGFAFSGLLLLWAIFRLQLVDLIPVARERVIESMGESLLILDSAGRLAATNPAARKLMAEVGGPAESVAETKLLGRSASELFPGWPDLAEALGAPAASTREFPLVKDDRPHHFDLRVSPLLGQGDLVTGWVAVLYDITRLKNAETAAIEARKIAEQKSARRSSARRCPRSACRRSRDHAAQAPFFLPCLVFHTYRAYYQHPRVLEGLGLGGRPPFPQGYSVAPTDFDALLARVRRLAPFYREP